MKVKEYCIHPEMAFILHQEFSLKNIVSLGPEDTGRPLSKMPAVAFLRSKAYADKLGSLLDQWKEFYHLTVVHEYQVPVKSSIEYLHFPMVENMVRFLCDWGKIPYYKSYLNLFPRNERTSLVDYVQIFWKVRYLPMDVKKGVLLRRLKELHGSAFLLYKAAAESFDAFVETFIGLQRVFPDPLLLSFFVSFLERVREFLYLKRLPPNPVYAECIRQFSVRIKRSDLIEAFLLLLPGYDNALLRIVQLRSILWGEEG